MRRCLALMMCLVLFFTNTAMATSTMTFVEDYSVSEKLWKQLTAGSGFKGTATMRISSEDEIAEATSMMFESLYVRADDDGEGAQYHASLTWGKESDETAHVFQIKQADGILYVQADAWGDTWYSFENAWSETSNLFAIPTWLYASLPTLMTGESSDLRYQQLLEDFLVQIDFWLETYRQTAEMQKSDSGVANIVMNYVITKEEIKEELKRLISELLADSTTLALLQNFLTTEQATQFLNPHLESFYHEAIDSLPLTSDLTIERTVNISGETVGLNVSFPICDAQGNPIAIHYQGADVSGDLLQQINVETEETAMEMRYQTQTVDEVLSIEAAVSSTDLTGENSNLAFVFHSDIDDQSFSNDDGEDVNTKELTITIGQDPNADFEEGSLLDLPTLEATAMMTFISKPLTNAATVLTGEVMVSDLETQKIATITFEAESTVKWTPDPFPTTAVLWATLSLEEQAQQVLLLLASLIG